MNIDYICLSDLHFGAENSLLTELEASGKPQYDKLSGVGEALLDCLEALAKTNGKRPTLVLAGDVLELALAETHSALMCFRAFVGELVRRDIVERRILLIPGNHDHHIWEVGREDLYLSYVQHEVARRRAGRGHEAHPRKLALGPAWSVTRLYSLESNEQDDGIDPPRARLLEAVLDDKTVEIQLVYPNMGLGRGLAHSVVFTHGHFVESIYSVMSEMSAAVFASDPEPRELSVEELELENFAWIDFMWSLLGRSGAVGDHVQQIYELASDEEGRRELAERIAKAIHRAKNMTWLPDVIEEWGLKKLVDFALKWLVNQERHRLDEADACKEAALAYARGPLHRQINHERHDNAPSRLTMIFGHTHKPFVRGFEGGEEIALCNTGGWVVDSVAPKRSHGAAIAVVGRRCTCGRVERECLCEYGCAAIRMYNEPHEGRSVAAAAVTPIANGSEADSELASALEQHHFGAGPWERFRAVVTEAIALRRLALHRRLHIHAR